MSESEGVGTGEGDQFLNGEVLGFKLFDDLIHGHVSQWHVPFYAGLSGHQAVLAAKVNGVEGSPNHGNGVTCGQGEDVGARDNAGAGKLDGSLGTYNYVESIAGKREVDVGVTFGLVEGIAGDEYGSVTASYHAVMEEEAEGASGSGGVADLFGGDDISNDVVQVRARLPVIVRRKLGL